ncbi:MAG: pyridoxal kinase [Hyphomonadaceae bacterium]|jgi:pyridoxine kinase|nr:pyridoxal kinase [Hyphomonadaceae bacterium]
MARVLAISSHVARGHVGLAATVPALQWLGHEVWTLPTVLLASRPGLGRLAKHELPPPDLDAMLGALEADGCWGSLDAVLTGYFPSPQAVAVAAQAIRRIRQANRKALVFVDPILGDADRLYVASEVAEAIRDQLLPLATIATPNLFELRWLSGAAPTALEEIALIARRLGPPVVIVTSALQAPTTIATLLATGSGFFELSLPARPDIANGAGDLFAGLLLGHLLNGHATEAALDAALQNLDRVLAASERQPVLQLSALLTCSG